MVGGVGKGAGLGGGGWYGKRGWTWWWVGVGKGVGRGGGGWCGLVAGVVGADFFCFFIGFSDGISVGFSGGTVSVGNFQRTFSVPEFLFRRNNSSSMLSQQSLVSMACPSNFKGPILLVWGFFMCPTGELQFPSMLLPFPVPAQITEYSDWGWGVPPPKIKLVSFLMRK